MSLKKVLFLLLCNAFVKNSAHQFTLMLDPAGDAKHAGRVIEDSFERGITLQCAEKLKKELEFYNPNVRVILTRFPGESLEPLQNANFANRLEVDLYISFHFYYEDLPKPELFIYYFVNDTTDSWQKPTTSLSFLAYDKAHRDKLARTKNAAQTLEKFLKQELYTSLFECKGVFGIPFKPLVGIIGPALGIEMSLKKKDQWITYLKPLCQSIINVIAMLDKS